MSFPNKAGHHADTDDLLAAELEAAGIEVLRMEVFRQTSGEVKTAVRGSLHGWTFERAWYYWMCRGPGIEVAAAERLHAAHGQTVRVNGDAGCGSPREWFNGLACGAYHVDDAEGLKALADTIRALVADPAPGDAGRVVLTGGARPAEAIEQLQNALRLVMGCAGDIDQATEAELEAALTCGDAETERQANAWLVARAALAATTEGAI